MTYVEAAALGAGASGAVSAHEDGTGQDSRQWTIKGLDPAVVEKARAAAKNKGMKISAWVAATLESAAERQLTGLDPSNHSPLSIDISEIVSKIEQSRNEDRLLIEKMEKDISLLVRGQHGILAEMVTRWTDKDSP